LVEEIYSIAVFLIFVAVVAFFTWLLLKIFPSLKKLNWKIIAGSFFVLKLFDTHSTYLCFAKSGDYSGEANFVFRLFYKGFGLEPMLAFLLASALAIIFGLFLLKILINRKFYFFTYVIVVGVFLAALNNYYTYFFLI